MKNPKSTLRQLSEASPYAGMTAEAPAALVLCCRKTDIKVPELIDADMSLATENILLEIEAFRSLTMKINFHE